MATWKKVIVSGSAAELLNITASAANIANISSSNIITARGTGSFSGSFQGDGSGLTNVPASGIVLAVLSQSLGIENFSYNGQNSAEVQLATGSAHFISGSRKTISVVDTTGASGIDLTYDQGTGVLSGSLVNSTIGLGSSTLTLGATTTTVDGLTLTNVVATGSFSGSFVGTTNLPDLTAGTGISTFTYDGATTATVAVSGAAQLTNNVVTKWNSTDGKFVDSSLTDNGTVVSGASSIQLTGASSNLSGSFSGSFTGDGSISNATSASFASTASYVNALSQSVFISGSLNLALTGSSSLIIEGNSFGQTQLSAVGPIVLNPGAGGVGMAGVNQYITAGYFVGQTAGTQLTGSFTGSFKGDGSGLTGVPASGIVLQPLTAGAGIVPFTYSGSVAQSVAISESGVTNAMLVNSFVGVSGSAGTPFNVNLGSGFTIAGTSNEIETSAAGATLTIGLPNDVTIGNNLIVNNNLTVLGTASFQNTQNLEVADRFILLASGSNSNGDGGFIVQQTTQNVGEVFGYHTSNTRWGVATGFNASASAFTPDAFMAAVVVSASLNPNDAPAIYDRPGNIYVSSGDESIYIYS